MKLETSFSNVSQFTLLALIQLSKVLKWTLLVLCLMSGVLKGVKLLLTFVPVLPMPWNESNLYLWPNLYLGHVSGSWNDSCHCPFHCWLISHLSEGSWKESQILQLSPLLAVLAVCDLKWLSNPHYTYIRVLKWGLERNSFCILFACFDTRVLKWGLERSQICVLSIHLNCCCAQICFYAVYKGPYHRYCYFGEIVSFACLAVTGCAIFWHNTFMRPSLTLARCPMMISLHAGVSTMKTDGLEMNHCCNV